MHEAPSPLLLPVQGMHHFCCRGEELVQLLCQIVAHEVWVVVWLQVRPVLTLLGRACISGSPDEDAVQQAHILAICHTSTQLSGPCNDIGQLNLSDSALSSFVTLNSSDWLRNTHNKSECATLESMAEHPHRLGLPLAEGRLT